MKTATAWSEAAYSPFASTSRALNSSSVAALSPRGAC